MGDSKLSMMASAMGSSRSRWMVRAEVPGPVGDGVGLLCKVIPQGFVPGKGQAPLRQGIPKLSKHNPGNGPEVLLGQVVEADDLIHPVQKFRPQELPQAFMAPSFLCSVRV